MKFSWLLPNFNVQVYDLSISLSKRNVRRSVVYTSLWTASSLERVNSDRTSILQLVADPQRADCPRGGPPHKGDSHE